MLTFLGFLMGFSSSDEEVSSDFLRFLLLLSFFLLLLPRVGVDVDFFRAMTLRQKIRLWPTTPQALQVTP
jgi:hypothetical protein